MGQEVHDRFAERLGRDLDDGTWDARYGHFREQPFFESSLVMLVSPGPGAWFSLGIMPESTAQASEKTARRP